jgi:hypothetical protein
MRRVDANPVEGEGRSNPARFEEALDPPSQSSD